MDWLTRRLSLSNRRTHNVSDKTHAEILQEFGWTEDEYEDGERVCLAPGRGLIAASWANLVLSLHRKMTTSKWTRRSPFWKALGLGTSNSQRTER